MVLGALSFGIFLLIWLTVQAKFARRTAGIYIFFGMIAVTTIGLGNGSLNGTSFLVRNSLLWGACEALCFIMTGVEIAKILNHHYNSVEPLQLEVNPVLA